MRPPRNLCLFDLDDTLLPMDSDHAWSDFLTTLGWVDAAEFKRRNDAFFEQYRACRLDIHDYVEFSTRPLRTHTVAECEAAQRRFMQERIEPMLRPQALALVRSHAARGDLIALVTATNDFVTTPIARAFGISDLLAVRLERGAEGTITGRIDGTPSYREGKVTRVQQWLVEQGADWADFERISVYSDSVNDLPLLERATDPVATNPTPELRTLAQARGWRILQLFD